MASPTTLTTTTRAWSTVKATTTFDPEAPCGDAAADLSKGAIIGLAVTVPIVFLSLLIGIIIWRSRQKRFGNIPSSSNSFGSSSRTGTGTRRQRWLGRWTGTGGSTAQRSTDAQKSQTAMSEKQSYFITSQLDSRTGSEAGPPGRKASMS